MALLPPIVNPGVPYVGPIEKGFTPGEMVRIQGLTSPTTDRFTINLQCGDGTDPGIDIALHLSVRVSENYVVLNTKENGTWGKEKIPNTPLPIGQGQHFEILLLCDDKDYKLAVNGQHFAEFHHRMDRSRVTHLSIKGNVEISLICYEGGTPAVPEESKDAGISFAETPTVNKDIDLSIDDFKPSAPLNPVYPTLPPADDTRGPAGYSGPGGYGPGPGGYGPPAGQGGYGPPQGPGGYGPPPGQGGYGPPGAYGPPAGQGAEKPGPFESILGQVGRAAADAISTGAIRGILAGPNAPPQHGPIGGGYPGYQGPGGGPLSSLLSSFTSGGGNSQGGGQSGGLGGALGGLLSGALSQHSQPSQNQGPVQGQYQGQGPYPPQGGPQSGGQNQGEGLGGFLSGALSSLMSGQNQRH